MLKLYVNGFQLMRELFKHRLHPVSVRVCFYMFVHMFKCVCVHVYKHLCEFNGA